MDHSIYTSTTLFETSDYENIASFSSSDETMPPKAAIQNQSAFGTYFHQPASFGSRSTSPATYTSTMNSKPPAPSIPTPEKIEVLKQLSGLQQPAYKQQDANKKAINHPYSELVKPRADGMKAYITKASQILKKLGPSYDEVVAIKTVQGIHDDDIKQTVAMLMRGTVYTFAGVEEILLASVE